MSQITFRKRGASQGVIAREDGSFTTESGEKIPATTFKEAIAWLKKQSEPKK